MPVLGALLLADVIVHRDQPLLSLITTRGWWYLLIAGALLLVRSRREEWLTRVDRRFFRERYDAHRLLTSIAEQVGRASSFDVIAPSIARQIDEALHPTFVSVLTHLSRQFELQQRCGARTRRIRPRRTPGFADRDQSALRPAEATGAVARRYRLGPSSTPIGRTDPAAGIRDRAPRADLEPLGGRVAARADRHRAPALGRAVRSGGSRAADHDCSCGRRAAAAFVRRGTGARPMRTLRSLLRGSDRLLRSRQPKADKDTRDHSDQRPVPARVAPRARRDGNRVRGDGYRRSIVPLRSR